MNNNNFTPGPWEALTDFETLDIVTKSYIPETGGHPAICKVDGYKGFTYGQKKANAKLIAESPVMYDLLREILCAAEGDELTYKSKLWMAINKIPDILNRVS